MRSMRTERSAKSIEHEEKNRKMSLYFLLFAPCTLLIVFCFAACGYTLYGKAGLPFQSIAVTKIVNKTFEPRLDDRMQIALTDELMRSGFLIDGSSGYRIIGNLTTFELKTLSEKAGVAVEYEVTITGDFRLVDPFGVTRQLRNRGVFIISFSSSETLQTVIALKEAATDRALKDFSSEIVASIIYDRPEVQRGVPSKETK